MTLSSCTVLLVKLCCCGWGQHCTAEHCIAADAPQVGAADDYQMVDAALKAVMLRLEAGIKYFCADLQLTLCMLVLMHSQTLEMPRGK
jgi:hypothetical protein